MPHSPLRQALKGGRYRVDILPLVLTPPMHRGITCRLLRTVPNGTSLSAPPSISAGCRESWWPSCSSMSSTLLFTLHWVNSGLAEEANPLLSEIAHSHPISFMSVKLGLVSLGSWLLWSHRHRSLGRHRNLPGLHRLLFRRPLPHRVPGEPGSGNSPSSVVILASWCPRVGPQLAPRIAPGGGLSEARCPGRMPPRASGMILLCV